MSDFADLNSFLAFDIPASTGFNCLRVITFAYLLSSDFARRSRRYSSAASSVFRDSLTRWASFSVASIGDNALVGARWDNRQDGLANGSWGAAYVFDGETGELLQTIANPTDGAWDAFGISIAAVGDQVLVGTQFGNVAHVFDMPSDAMTAQTDGSEDTSDAPENRLVGAQARPELALSNRAADQVPRHVRDLGETEVEDDVREAFLQVGNRDEVRDAEAGIQNAWSTLPN